MLQESRKACVVLLNKWDLVRKEDGGRASQGEQASVIRDDLFFLDYAPVICLSAKTGQRLGRVFTALKQVRRASQTRITTGELNRFFRDLFEVHPPPSKSGKRFKLLYATQVVPENPRPFQPPEFLLFVNDEELITDAYREYLFNRMREKWSFEGLPIQLRLKGRETREVQDRKKDGALRASGSRKPKPKGAKSNDRSPEDKGGESKKFIKPAPRPRRMPSHKPKGRLGGRKTRAPRKGRAPRR
jgi:hypothetical protein